MHAYTPTHAVPLTVQLVAAKQQFLTGFESTEAIWDRSSQTTPVEVLWRGIVSEGARTRMCALTNQHFHFLEFAEIVGDWASEAFVEIQVQNLSG